MESGFFRQISGTYQSVSATQTISNVTVNSSANVIKIRSSSNSANNVHYLLGPSSGAADTSDDILQPGESMYLDVTSGDTELSLICDTAETATVHVTQGRKVLPLQGS